MVEVLYRHITPLCFLPDGRLVCYQYGDLLIIEHGQELQRFALFKSLKERLCGRGKLISRFLRLGIRSATAIDNDSITISMGDTLYDVNLKTESLSNGYSCGTGVRPLSFTAVQNIMGFDDGVYFGGYVHNFNKNTVNVYHRTGVDAWEVVFSFQQGEINHVHSIIPDPYRNCLWILTGDFDDSAAIWKATDNFQKIERVVSGQQKYRSCVAFAIPEGLLYATDTPFDNNHIYLLNDKGTETIVADIPGSCIYGCKWKDKYVFSTTVEADGRNETIMRLLFGWKRGSGIKDNHIHLYLGSIEEGFYEIYKGKKDLLPFIFQFGAFVFPSGWNKTEWLYFQQIATKKNDLDLIGIQIA